MLYYQFANYEEFKKLFPVRETSGGKKVRQNSLLLKFYKSEKLLHACAKNGTRFPNVTSVSGMETHIKSEVFYCGDNFLPTFGPFHSSEYGIDKMCGICEDGDAKSVRYVLRETGKVYKMKATKFFSKILQENEYCKLLDPSVINYMASDVLAKEWETYAAKTIAEHDGQDYTLYVDDDFEAIYDSDRCDGNFGSCMTDKNLHGFYENSVTAKAACLTGPNGNIVARAIIFTEVKDADGNKYRLCERQYSTDGDERLKRFLVNALIAAGEIDGYKKIGAGCHDARAFVSNDGEDWSCKRFRIECNLEMSDPLSYQDSFKFYNYDRSEAYNYDDADYDYGLDTTEGSLEDRNYDDYHECYTANDVVDVYYRGNWISCDVDDLDDFTYCEEGPDGEGYYYEDYAHYDDYHECYTANDVVDVYYRGDWISCDVDDLDDFTYCENGPDGKGYYYKDYVKETVAEVQPA